jgi:hypothetical protein
VVEGPVLPKKGREGREEVRKEERKELGEKKIVSIQVKGQMNCGIFTLWNTTWQLKEQTTTTCMNDSHRLNNE